MSRPAEIGNDSITLAVKSGVNLSRLAPQMELTLGATIEPASGTLRDFTTVQYYTVSSEDRQWSKRYAVRVVTGTFTPIEGVVRFDFETIRLQGKADFPYHVFTVLLPSGEAATEWASGNAGFSLTGMAEGPTDYPTYQSAEGYEGACVELVTRSTGQFGNMGGKPMAAGNLFLGRFELSRAMAAPLEATKFGIPMEYEPETFSGYYFYEPGATFYVPGSNGLKPVSGRIDSCAIYAVFYESTPEAPYLNGANVLADDNPQIVSTAVLSADARLATDNWQHFELPFVPRDGKEVDPVKLRQGQYNLAIVFSSSAGGASFEGALGSRLRVDNVEVSFKER